MKKTLILIKKTIFWKLFLKYFFIKFYNFFWENIINFQGKVLYFQWRSKKKAYYELNNNDKLLVLDDPKIKQLANKIKLYVNEDIKNKYKNIVKNKIKSEEYNQFNDYRISIYDEINDDLKKEIIDLASSEKILNTAVNYLKVFPIIGKIALYMNFPVLNSNEKGAMLWHKDDFGYKSLDLFIAITDINENNGPLYFVKPKNSLGVFHKITQVVKNAKPGERNKVKLDIFRKYYKDELTDKLSGKCGSSLFIDSFTSYHRGGYCLTDDRIMLRISYQTPDASRVQNLDHSNGFYYLKTIKKENLGKFQSYIFFKKLNFVFRSINLPEMLLKLYSFLHFKA
tara:strand:- start:14208 stop:15227 length:1020 start_codon:yes stop_codon:yes gene_type:complete